MIEWDIFTNELKDFNNDRKSKSLEESAIFYANLYYNSILDSELTIGNKYIPNPGSISILENGFISFFTININLTVPISINNTLPLANAIITFWKSQGFKPLPPHPPTTSPTTGVTIDYWGDVNILATELLNSFTSELLNTVQSNIFVNRFAAALQNHLLLVLGNYYGLVPGSPPTPLVVPWVGVY